MRKRLLWQIFPVFLFVMLAGLVAISWNVSVLLKKFHRAEKTTQLERLARVTTPYFEGVLGSDQFEKMQSICAELGRASQLRFTLIDLEGKVLADSNADPRKMENHLMRPEVQAVLSGDVGSDVRLSETLGQEMLYVGLPLKQEGKIVAVLRITVPLVELRRATHEIITKIVRYGVIIAILLAVLSLLLSWRISRPLEVLRAGAQRFAQGDLAHRLPISQSLEIGALAESMNQMAEQLDERIRTIVAQGNEQEAVLASMSEGVLAVHMDGCIISLNKAAVRMFPAITGQGVGRTIEEVVRNTELQQFIHHTLDSAESTEDQIILHEDIQPERFIKVHGTALLGDEGRKIGVLVVLNDVTHIRRLEDVRRDFVANVSHELKTPVTSIRGFVETLLEGAMEKPEERRRFLEIISRQANRLDSIIDDLLMLSYVEQQDEQKQPALTPTRILPIVQAAGELCQVAAAQKNIRIEIDCADHAEASVNASLLEQAIVNLVDNAVKYSDADTVVRVEARRGEAHLIVRICDQGYGIAKEHLPRLFERFYRIDKARSRKLGGTGLGLAIVKHIAQYHKGTISVESTVGKGSVFTLTLPQQ